MKRDRKTDQRGARSDCDALGNSVLAPVSLMEAFPGLRAEEARAVCNDWRATYHERRTRLAARPV